MKIKCTNCNNEQDAKIPKNSPDGTVRIESNYCPNCDGDFYEEQFFNKNDELILSNKVGELKFRLNESE